MQKDVCKNEQAAQPLKTLEELDLKLGLQSGPMDFKFLRVSFTYRDVER